MKGFDQLAGQAWMAE